MIQLKTLLNVSDNSGIKTVRYIRSKKDDNLLVSIFEKKIKTSIKKGALFLATLVREKTFQKKKNGIFLSFDENSVVLLNSKNNLIGTRFFGPIPSKLRKNKLLKILCLTLTIL
jgi:large subunit ribosomal protein L14